ncbi:hypothetical protein EIP86_000790 [Pleurotus ostreatoroseus]|nr:hypothetical protein EIP86_000790 [Pleurotus ostreatoroseus]
MASTVPVPPPEAPLHAAQPAEEEEEEEVDELEEVAERPRKRSREQREDEDEYESSEEMYETLDDFRTRMMREIDEERTARRMRVADEEVDMLENDEVLEAPASGASGSARDTRVDDNQEIPDYRAPFQDHFSESSEEAQTTVDSRHASEPRTEPASTSEDQIRYAPYLISEEDKENADPTRSVIVSRSDRDRSFRPPLTPLPANGSAARDGDRAFHQTLIDTLARLGTILNRDDGSDTRDRLDISTVATPGTGNSTPVLVAYAEPSEDPRTELGHSSTKPVEEPNADLKRSLAEFECRLAQLVDAATSLQHIDYQSRGRYAAIERTIPTPPEAATFIPPYGDRFREEFAEALHGLNAAGLPGTEDYHGTRLSSPAIHVSQLTGPASNGDVGSHVQPFAPIWTEQATNAIATGQDHRVVDEQGIPTRTAVVLGSEEVPMEQDGEKGKEAQLNYPNDSSQDVVAPPSYTPMPRPPGADEDFQYPLPFHLPQNFYHSVYIPQLPPPPVMKHQHLRNVLSLVFRHLFLQARILDMEAWVVETHEKTHDSTFPSEQAFHDRVFLLTSEWAGNPFLWAYEESTLVQCAEYYKFLGKERGYDTPSSSSSSGSEGCMEESANWSPGILISSEQSRARRAFGAARGS